MVLMLMVRAIALHIIVLLLYFFFQNGSHVHNNFKPAHGGLSKPLADISPYLCRVGKKGHGILAFITNSTFVKKRSNFQVSDIE